MKAVSLEPQSRAMSSSKEMRVDLPLLAIAGSACWECTKAKDDGTGLNRCKGCKRAVYCSSGCQKQNWALEHRRLCKPLRRLNDGPKADRKLTWTEFKDLQHQRYFMIVDRDEHGVPKPESVNLGRAVQYQPKCENCLRTPFDHVASETFLLTPCDNCKLAFFCSPSCRAESLEQHKRKQCFSLKDAGACELVKMDHLKETGEPVIQLPTQSPHRTYKPLHTAQNWKEYFQDISTSPFAEFITEDFSPAKDDKVFLHACRFLKVAVDSSSFILTILAGLESEIPNLASCTKLTIHIVGAGWEEIRRGTMTEELYHLLPKIERLVIGYVGPDVGSTSGSTTQLLDFECCPECQKMGRSPRQAFLANDLYHDFAKSDLFANYPPDLVVALHSGHAESEVQRWQPTLKRILDLDVPALFTTYNNKEAVEEEHIFESLGAHFSKRLAENPWRGVLPKFDMFMDRHDVYYFNYYWYIVKGRKHE